MISNNYSSSQNFGSIKHTDAKGVVRTIIGKEESQMLRKLFHGNPALTYLPSEEIKGADKIIAHDRFDNKYEIVDDAEDIDTKFDFIDLKRKATGQIKAVLQEMKDLGIDKLFRNFSKGTGKTQIPKIFPELSLTEKLSNEIPGGKTRIFVGSLDEYLDRQEGKGTKRVKYWETYDKPSRDIFRDSREERRE